MSEQNTVDWASLKKTADDATKPAPEGPHICEITKAEATTAQSSGNPMIKVTMKIVEGPAAGKTIFNNFNLTLDNAWAMGIFFRHMAALGLTDEFFATGPSMEQVAASLVERRAKVTVGIRQWQGQDRNQVENVEPVGGQAPVTSAAAAYAGPGPSTPGAPSGLGSAAGPSVPGGPSVPVGAGGPGVPSVPGPPPAF